MTEADRNIIYYGRPEPLPERIPLRAGPLSMIFEAGDLRYIRHGSTELVRRIYAAVRDRNWGTVPMEMFDVNVQPHADAFAISFTARHRRPPIDFEWRGRIESTSAGRITFTFDGVARSTFLKNRIGLCVLHPDHCAGARCIVRKVDGGREEGSFPIYISPHQPFLDIASIAHEAAPGVWCDLEFSGDVFEMEDQRNWTDASFKTYSTPLRLPFPAQISGGTEVRQSVALSVRGSSAAEVSVPDDRVVKMRVGATGGELPRLGLSLTPDYEPSTAELARLRGLKLAHLRVDLRLDQPAFPRQLSSAAEHAREIGAALEVSLHCTDDAERDLAAFVTAARRLECRIERFLVHALTARSSPPHLLVESKRVLRAEFPSVPIVGGTAAYFTELNRNRPSIDLIDGVCYSINPQVHAFDNSSLTECAGAIRSTVESARQFAGGLRIHVTPVTLKPRFNPDATAGDEAGSDQLPPQVDVRQMSLYGACWTLASLKYLAEAGAASVTYYQTVGWLGVMEREAGSPRPSQFRSTPGGVFPLYHVLADVGEFGGGRARMTASSDPLRVEAVTITQEARTRLMLANMTDQVQDVSIAGTSAPAKVRFLDELSVRIAVASPEQFRGRRPQPLAWGDGPVPLTLRPYAIAVIDYDRQN